MNFLFKPTASLEDINMLPLIVHCAGNYDFLSSPESTSLAYSAGQLASHPIKQGDVSERREPTNCNSLCRWLPIPLCCCASCLLPLAACRVSDARDIGFLGMRRKQKCCPILAIPDSDDYELRSEAADSQQPATDSMHSSC